MVIAAVVFILHYPEYRISIGATLMISTLLDWVDGPVARAWKQSTVMGCGWDWLADILTQFGKSPPLDDALLSFIRPLFFPISYDNVSRSI